MAADKRMQNSGFEWRSLLGPCHDWPAPLIEPTTAEAQNIPLERCEVCRQPVDSSKAYITNSAGEQAIHLACLQENGESATRQPGRSGLPVWRWLLSFAHL